MSEGLKFVNPETIHAPIGAYSHSVLVPAGSRMLFIAGQLGIRPDGSLGSTIGEQADQAYLNIKTILQSNDMEMSNIVRLNQYVVVGQPGEDVRAARNRHLGDHRPASASFYVPQLYLPQWFIEIEVIAACP